MTLSIRVIYSERSYHVESFLAINHCTPSRFQIPDSKMLVTLVRSEQQVVEVAHHNNKVILYTCQRPSTSGALASREPFTEPLMVLAREGEELRSYRIHSGKKNLRPVVERMNDRG